MHSFSRVREQRPLQAHSSMGGVAAGRCRQRCPQAKGTQLRPRQAFPFVGGVRSPQRLPAFRAQPECSALQQPWSEVQSPGVGGSHEVGSSVLALTQLLC